MSSSDSFNTSSRTAGGASTSRSTTAAASSSGHGLGKRRYEETTTTTTRFTEGATPARAARYEVSGSESEFLSVATGKSAIVVHEVDPDGHYIKLFNGSDKDISLKDWTLKQLDGDQEVIHKFAARGGNLKSHAYLTIWSHGSDQASGASDVTMKPRSVWLSGDNLRTILSDAKGEEMAVRQLKRHERVASPSSDDNDSREGGRVGSSFSRLSGMFSVFM